MQIEPDKRWATKEEKVNKDVSGVLLMVSLKLLLSPVMMISKRDRILTACRTKGYFHGRTQRQQQNNPTPAPPGTGHCHPSPSCSRIELGFFDD